MSMNGLLKKAFMTCSLILPTIALAYEELTHEEISSAALMRSEIANGRVLTKIGVIPYSNYPVFPNPDNSTSANDICTIKSSGLRYCDIDELIRHGSRFEDRTDPYKRPLNHFFDPIYERPLTILGPNDGWLELGYTSLDWATEFNGELFETTFRPEQEYSYRDANKCFYLAVTSPSYQARDEAYGCMFQLLGQVIHHVQDMAQPDHVRNDQHHVNLDPSYYEHYTLEKTREADFVSWMQSTTYPLPLMTRITDFWTTRTDHPDILQRRGLADFTNRNFVSKDTVFHIFENQFTANAYYENPVPLPASHIVSLATEYGQDGQILCDYILSEYPDLTFPEQPCQIEYVQSNVHDADPNVSDSINHKAASYSVFNKFMSDYDVNAELDYGEGDVVVDKIFTLTEKNFDSAHEYLIPRAVSYSAAALNHFFKGDISAVPSRGSYDDIPEDIDGYEFWNFSSSSSDSELLRYSIEGVFKLYYWRIVDSQYELVPLPSAEWNTPGALGWAEKFHIDLPSSLPRDIKSNNIRLVFKGRVGGDGDSSVGQSENNTDFSVALDRYMTLVLSYSLFSEYVTDEFYIDDTLYDYVPNARDRLFVSFGGSNYLFERNGYQNASRDTNIYYSNHFYYTIYQDWLIVVEYKHDISYRLEGMSPLREVYYPSIHDLPTSGNLFTPATTEEMINAEIGYRTYESGDFYISKFLDNMWPTDHSIFTFFNHEATDDNSSVNILRRTPSNYETQPYDCLGYILSMIDPLWNSTTQHVFYDAVNSEVVISKIENFIVENNNLKSAGNWCQYYEY